ncbi:antimicrobial peptide NK-lysin-like [Puntigrus tetrazona]|uniref:antimicrobial peptide NK-lysin-like n=1 Tax=Puntigrus tetrazona TaxID=1606681 RepID=UPI001C8A2B00|nr:antimicrobial peptide NK-lysin-like [Puntigrus tetrazona]XP_043118363.1 antimicrobial peptide NK-lysin-like [Puntigrus tetrazona]
MLRNILLVGFLVSAVCAAHWEIREVDSAEDQDEGISADVTPKQQIGVCSICKSVMKAVKKKLSANADAEEVKTKLNNTCEKMKLLSGPCKKLVKKYLHSIVDELMTDDGPKTICTKIHVCKPKLPLKEFIFMRDRLAIDDDDFE